MIRLDRMPMTPQRRRFIDDMRLRNLSPRTIETYVTAVVRVARHFQRLPEQLSAADVRGFQLHLLERPPPFFLFEAVFVLDFVFCLYPEGVRLHSPGSRFAHPGNASSPNTTYPEGFDKGRRSVVQPLRGRDRGWLPVSQGALAKPRDPGLWNTTPSG